MAKRIGVPALSLALLTACSGSRRAAVPPVPATIAAASSSAAPSPAPPPPSLKSSLPKVDWPPEKQALHVLNRLAYGPRPGETEAVAASGVERWIAEQLRPTSIDDHEVEAKFENLKSLRMSSTELHAAYPKANKKKALAAAAQSSAPEAMAPTMDEKKPKEIEKDLAAHRIVRAVESKRQLAEVLLDFWFNHFNVYGDKGQDKWLIISYERDALRPHLFGHFRELLDATAKHPAMLFYLDNWLSVAAESAPAAPAPTGSGKRSNGINENYARELLELHTLGVDGGYTQDDVRETARAFTGWSISHPNDEAEFAFHVRRHDKNPKTVLGHTVDAGGMGDGERVLDLVAEHPSTARFIATKLCRKFVSDDPPPALVTKIAAVFSETHGDLSAVYEAIFVSPEFWSAGAFDSKIKTPLELSASAMRALGATVTSDVALQPQLTRMGEPLYRAQPPTGYKEAADAWVNSGALVARINFGLALASGRLDGVSYQAEKVAGASPPPDAGALVDKLTAALLHRPLQASTRDTIVNGITSTQQQLGYQEPMSEEVPRAIGLLLGSPEFQKQ
jgi:uncharacterized protein (DUF1800 family)